MIRPTPQEIRKLHDYLKGIMPRFYDLKNYMEWGKKENGECPPGKTLWINNIYNDDDILEILNNALKKNIKFDYIEKKTLEDTIYAKIRENGSACRVLKSNIFNFLKKIHFSIQINKEKRSISLIIVARLEQQENEIQINLIKEDIKENDPKEKLKSLEKTFENVVNILKLLLCHFVTINPAQENSETVKRVFGKLDEETRVLYNKILNTNFIKAFIHTYEEDHRCFNPFASFFRKDFEDDCFKSMWALEQKFSFSSSKEQIEKEFISQYDYHDIFKSHLKLSGCYKFSFLKIEYMDDYDKVMDVRDIDIIKRGQLESKAEVNGQLIPVKNIKDRDQEKKAYIIKKNVSEFDLPYFKENLEQNKILRPLSDDEKSKYSNIINASECQWLSRFEMFIKQLNTVVDSKKLDYLHPSWQVGVDNHMISLNIGENIEKLKNYLEESAKESGKKEYDIIQELATEIDFRRNEKEKVIDEIELSIILGILLNFIKKNPDWDKIAIQCIMILGIKEPNKVKGIGNQKNSFNKLLILLKASGMKKRIKDAYYYDLLLAILEQEDLSLYYPSLTIYSESTLSENLPLFDTYKQNEQKTALYENSVQIGNTYITKN